MNVSLPGPRLRSVAMVGLILLAACSGSARGPAVGEDGRPARRDANVLTAADIDRLPTVNSVLDLMRYLPGMVIGGDVPGTRPGGMQMQRGDGTPLFIVDGVPLSNPNTALAMNPRDIARIEVVKDGGELAAYGFRGSNGAVLITTK